MSNTRSASGGIPRAKPKLVTVTSIPSSGAFGEAVADHLLQVARVERRGVDHRLGPAAQRFHQFALGADALDHRAALRQRMAAAGLVVAALELDAGAVEEQCGDGQVGACGQFLPARDDRVRIESAGARIEPDRERRTRIAVCAFRSDKPVDEADREIVDRLPPEVFEHAQRRGLARARQPGHQHHPLALPGLRISGRVGHAARLCGARARLGRGRLIRAGAGRAARARIRRAPPPPGRADRTRAPGWHGR